MATPDPDRPAGQLESVPPARSAAELELLFPVVYDELRRVAHRSLGRQGPSTLGTTELVHEVYLKLLEGQAVGWDHRAHFFALASRAMRFILVDRARARSAAKRGGRGSPVTLDEAVAGADRSEDLLAIDEALERLAGHSDRLARLVQYRFFGGMAYEEIAEVTGLSVPTVKRDWARARTWLHRFMDEAAPPA